MLTQTPRFQYHSPFVYHKLLICTEIIAFANIDSLEKCFPSNVVDKCRNVDTHCLKARIRSECWIKLEESFTGRQNGQGNDAGDCFFYQIQLFDYSILFYDDKASKSALIAISVIFELPS